VSRDGDEDRTFSGREARQGEIILRRRWQRIVFIAGLAGVVILVGVAACVG
jgi:hypothetical protein